MKKYYVPKETQKQTGWNDPYKEDIDPVYGDPYASVREGSTYVPDPKELRFYEDPDQTSEGREFYPLNTTFTITVMSSDGTNTPLYHLDMPQGMLVEYIGPSISGTKVRVRFKRYQTSYKGDLSQTLLALDKKVVYQKENRPISEEYKESGWEEAAGMGLIYKDEGANLWYTARTDEERNREGVYLYQNERVYLMYHNPATHWYFVATQKGEMGYINANFVWKQGMEETGDNVKVNTGIIPDPRAIVRKVKVQKKGQTTETMLGIAMNHYAEKFDDWGKDKRWMVAALAYFNIRYNPNATGAGVYSLRNGKNAPLDKDAGLDWKDVGLDAGKYIWLPSVALLEGLYQSGKLKNPSWSYNVVDALWKAGEVLYKVEAFQLSLLGGVVHGAARNVWDAVMDVVDSVTGTFKTIWKAITGELWADLKKFWEAMCQVWKDGKIWEVLKQIGEALFKPVLDYLKKVTSDNPWVAGHAVGFLTGYIAAEVIISVLSGGAKVGLKMAGLPGKLGGILGALIEKGRELANKLPSLKKLKGKFKKKEKMPEHKKKKDRDNDSEKNKVRRKSIEQSREDIKNKINQNPKFELKYTDAEIDDLIKQGRGLDLDDDAIESLVYIGARQAKPLSVKELSQQMDNYVNIVLKRGYPFKFVDLVEFNKFKKQLNDGLKKIGVSTDDVRIQGSSLRTKEAKDVDLAVFIKDSDFDSYLVKAFEGKIRTSSGEVVNLTNKNTSELYELAKHMKNHKSEYNSKADTFLHAILERKISSKTKKPEIIPGLRTVRKDIADTYPDLNVEDISIMTRGGELDLKPFMKLD